MPTIFFHFQQVGCKPQASTRQGNDPDYTLPVSSARSATGNHPDHENAPIPDHPPRLLSSGRRAASDQIRGG
jgi:hypothetical protein